MRYKIYYVLCFCLLVLASANAFAQDKPEWIRAVSDNGEFSVEVPAEYGFFADKNGYTVPASSNTYELREMRMFNAYTEKTLISFESYKANKAALEALRQKEFARDAKVSETKLGDVKIKQVVIQTPASYAVKKYFSSKNYIYILTAASRSGETAAMKRFFDSLIFTPGGKALTSTTAKAVAFADLKGTPIEIDSSPNDSSLKDKNPLPTPPVKDESISNLVIVSKPRASYTDAARQNREEGTVKMRVTFSKDGRISKISTMQILKEGLLRQSVFAAIRIKFLPQEKDGEPVTVTKVIEYSFDIY